jgi:hypothetical protein
MNGGASAPGHTGVGRGTARSTMTTKYPAAGSGHSQVTRRSSSGQDPGFSDRAASVRIRHGAPTLFFVPVAQLDRAPRYERGGMQVRVLSGAPILVVDISGCSSVWQSACLGSRRSPVQARLPSPCLVDHVLLISIGDSSDGRASRAKRDLPEGGRSSMAELLCSTQKTKGSIPSGRSTPHALPR